VKLSLIILGLLIVVGGFLLSHEVRKKSGFLWLAASTTAELFTQKTGPEIIERFHRDMARYPTSDEGLSVLFHAPGPANEARWKGPYLRSDRIPRDPWNREYQYRYPGLKNPRNYDLWSLGQDGVISHDDIGNWSK
jgi:general secretion pathway protein G